MLARLVRATSRRLGRGGGTTLPGRLLLRLDKRAIAPPRRPARGRHDAALRHERQDDDGVDDRRHPRARGPAGGAQRRRLEHALGHRDRADRRRPPTRRARPVRGRRGVAARGRAASSRRDTFVLCNLFRDQLDRYGELELLADRWAELVGAAGGLGALRAERGRPAGRRPRPGAPRRRLLRRLGRLAGAPRAAARGRLEALPQLRHALRLRGRLPGPPRPLSLSGLRPAAARAGGGRGARRARRDGRARGSRCARRPARPTSASPSPASTTSTTRSPRRPPRSSSGASLERREGVARGAGRRVRACRDDPRGRPRRLDPPGEEPRRRERGPAHAHPGGPRARPLDRAERQDRRRPRRLVGLGCRLRAARRARAARRPARGRARRRWRCG